ncbi:MAG: VOC family protein [Lachnospirales bacterium]
MVGVEIDFVVKDTLKAIESYRKVFDVETIEETKLQRGQNEVIFSIYGTRFHMLDENHEYQLIAPIKDVPQSVWFNVLVEDIKETHKKALAEGYTQLQEVTEMTDFGVSNCMFADNFGYIWMLHQVHREVSFEDRMKLFEEGKF